MELSHGHVITLDKARQLGVLEAAEGLARESEDQPWEVIVPADNPVEQDGDGDEQELEEQPEMAEETHHNVSLYRAMHHLNRGGLHRALGIAEGQSIPHDRLEAAKKSSNEHVRHMANFASTMGHFKH